MIVALLLFAANARAATSLYPPIAKSDMSAYGAAGRFLAEHPPGLPDLRGRAADRCAVPLHDELQGLALKRRR